jgi:hypothetical protein
MAKRRILSSLGHEPKSGNGHAVPHELSTGDSFYLASNVPHGVEVILPTRVLDTFSPPRNDYLAIDEKSSPRRVVAA